MKSICLLIVLGVCLATEITSPKLLLELQARTENVIDDGVQLLQDLLNSAEANLEQIQNENEAELTKLNEEIANKEAELYDVQNTCMQLSDDLALLKQRIELHGDDVAYFRNEIVKDTRRIEVLQGLRCQSSTNWLNFIKSGKYILNLIDFLRHAINNYNSFAEIPHFGIMLETLSKEVDDQSILNSLQAVSKSRAIGPVKQELLQLLDQIEESIQLKVNTSQTDEILSASRVSDYLDQLNQEITWYENEIKKLNENFGDQPEETVKQRQRELDQCESGIHAKLDEAKQIKETVNEKIIHNESRQATYFNQRDLVQQLIGEYQVAFSKISDTYKLRIDDYVEDGVFDKTPDFDSRSLTDLYGDKEESFQQYVDDLVNGVQTPIEVTLNEEETNNVEVESESESEESEESEELEESEEEQESEEEPLDNVDNDDQLENENQDNNNVEVEEESTNQDNENTEDNYFEQGEVPQV